MTAAPALLALWASSGAAANAVDQAQVVVSTTLKDPQLLSLDDLRRQLNLFVASQVNVISVPIAWSAVAPSADQFDLAPYFPALDLAREKGLRLLFLLDTSNRSLMDGSRLVGRALPGWVAQGRPEILGVDFQRGRHGLDVFDSTHRPDVATFYARTIGELQKRYGNRIVGFAPAFSTESEIKLDQEGYVWQGYSDVAVTSWRNRVHRPDAGPPVPSYNNMLGGAPRAEPGYGEWMETREDGVAQYACWAAQLIHSKGARAVAFFGQALATHDAIYATGTVEKTASCFDIAVFDYNYFDGYQETLDPYVVPLLANYAAHLGYPQVWGGYYFERTHNLAAAFEATRQSLALLSRQPAVRGMEMGNLPWAASVPPSRALQIDNFRQLLRQPQLRQRYRIGLFASKWNTYLWHGNHANDRDLLADAVTAAFAQLSQLPDVEVVVFGESGLQHLDQLGHLDAIVAPHQTVLTDEAVRSLTTYWQGGGKLVQDMRWGEFTPDGASRGAWMSKVFGIGGIHWITEEGRFRYCDRSVRLRSQPRMYATAAELSARPGATVLMPDEEHPGTGLILRTERTLVFGFLPQLVGRYADDPDWKAVYRTEILSLLAGP